MNNFQSVASEIEPFKNLLYGARVNKLRKVFNYVKPLDQKI